MSVSKKMAAAALAGLLAFALAACEVDEPPVEEPGTGEGPGMVPDTDDDDST